jgi:hypothetical protein
MAVVSSVGMAMIGSIKAVAAAERKFSNADMIPCSGVSGRVQSVCLRNA